MLILIAGLSGAMGSLLAKEALARGHRVRGLGRSAQRVPKSLEGSIEFIEYSSYHDEDALDVACRECDAVICAYGVISELIVEGQLFLLRAADRANIKRFVAASWNGDYRRLELGDMESYDPHIIFRTQSQLESNVQPIYMLTGAFSEVLLGSYHDSKGSNPWRPKTQQLDIWGTGNERMAISTMRDSAEWTVRVLDREDAAKGGDWFVFSFEASFRELAGVFKAVTGKEMQVTERGTLEDLAKIEREKRAAGVKTDYWQYLGWTYLKNMLGGVFEGADDVRNSEFPEESRTSIEDALRQSIGQHIH